ncbi:hypothetical protein ACIQXI_08815 [Lysinibacillus sp. NPDC097195]|uniref:hypothetical protein n=1 Tax=Lysinibacillus sp. NPDC097195 TaxID=3364141 RepID=UPI0038189E6A
MAIVGVFVAIGEGFVAVASVFVAIGEGFVALASVFMAIAKFLPLISYKNSIYWLMMWEMVLNLLHFL